MDDEDLTVPSWRGKEASVVSADESTAHPEGGMSGLSITLGGPRSDCMNGQLLPKLSEGMLRWAGCLLVVWMSALGFEAESPAADGQAETSPLKWDALSKETVPDKTAVEARFVFNFTNGLAEPVVIQKIHTSCGCTVAKAARVPWPISPGTNGHIDVIMDLRGRFGLFTKTVFVETSHGTSILQPRVQIKHQPPIGKVVMPTVGGKNPSDPVDRRQANMQLASADRQAVFRGDCAGCHAAPARGKSGARLYAAVCGICHDAEHRASMVPDLTQLNKPTPASYWNHWIRIGNPVSIMPAFAKSVGGPLSDEQISSLVEFLKTDR
jgi:mono/diheme cytochrome c family protein